MRICKCPALVTNCATRILLSHERLTAWGLANKLISPTPRRKLLENCFKIKRWSVAALARSRQCEIAIINVRFFNKIYYDNFSILSSVIYKRCSCAFFYTYVQIHFFFIALYIYDIYINMHNIYIYFYSAKASKKILTLYCAPDLPNAIAYLCDTTWNGKIAVVNNWICSAGRERRTLRQNRGPRSECTELSYFIHGFPIKSRYRGLGGELLGVTHLIMQSTDVHSLSVLWRVRRESGMVLGALYILVYIYMDKGVCCGPCAIIYTHPTTDRKTHLNISQCISAVAPKLESTASEASLKSPPPPHSFPPHESTLNVRVEK